MLASPGMIPVPVLHTPRLRLRAHRPEDHGPALELWQSPDVVRNITGWALSSHDVWLRLLRYSGLWDFLGYGYWAVEDRASGTYVGQMGFADFRRGLEGVGELHPEAGWVVHPGWSGRGLATEGMGAACAWLDEATGWSRSHCLIGPGNGASIRVAEKLGYRPGLETSVGGHPSTVFTRSRSGEAGD